MKTIYVQEGSLTIPGELAQFFGIKTEAQKESEAKCNQEEDTRQRVGKGAGIGRSPKRTRGPIPVSSLPPVIYQGGDVRRSLPVQ